MAETHIVIEGMSEFLRALKSFVPEVRKDFNEEARGVLSTIAGEAKSGASWSRRIPGAIKVTVTNTAAGLRLSKKAAPHGGLYELGGHGGGQFRHPLYGNRNFWYTQSTRPFLLPAVDRHRDSGVEAMFKAIDNAKEKVGL